MQPNETNAGADVNSPEQIKDEFKEIGEKSPAENIQPSSNLDVQQPLQNQTPPAIVSAQTAGGVIRPTVTSSSGGSTANQAEFQQSAFATPINSAPQSLAAAAAPKKSKKKLLAGLAALTILLLGAAGYVFGFYIPNKPENVWKTGIVRTGEGLDALVEKIADPQALTSLAKNKITVTGNIDTSRDDYSFNLSSVFDEKSTDSNVNVEAKLESMPDDIKIGAKIKSQATEDSIWPNIYFNVTGLSSLGLDEFLPGISNYDGKWVALEQDFYQEILSVSESEAGESAPKNLTQQDVASLAADANAVVKEYVFTDDESKSVLVMEEFIGTETSEGRSANRYRVSLHEENSTAFCKALIEKLYAYPAFMRFAGISDEQLEEVKKSDLDSCEPDENDSPDSIKESFDVWIDRKQKLLHKFRFTEDLEKIAEQKREEQDKCMNNFNRFGDDAEDICAHYTRGIETGERYNEVGQVYDGKNNIKLFFKEKSDTNLQKYTLRGDFDIDMEALDIDGKVTYQNTSDENGGSGEVTITSEPYEGEIESAKPDGAIPILQVYQEIMSLAQSQIPQGQQLGASTEEQVDTPSKKGYFETLLERITAPQANSTE